MGATGAAGVRVGAGADTRGAPSPWEGNGVLPLSGAGGGAFGAAAEASMGSCGERGGAATAGGAVGAREAGPRGSEGPLRFPNTYYLNSIHAERFISLAIK